MGVLDDLLATTGLFGATGDDLGLPTYTPLDYIPAVDENNANYLRLVVELIQSDPAKAQKVYALFRNDLRNKWAYGPVYGMAAPINPGTPTDLGTFQFWANRVNTSAKTYGKEVLQKWADGGILERAHSFMKLWKSVLDGPLSSFPEDKPWYKISSKTLWGEEQYPYFKFFEETAKQGWYPRGLPVADRPAIDEAAKNPPEAPPWWWPLSTPPKEAGGLIVMGLVVVVLIMAAD